MDNAISAFSARGNNPVVLEAFNKPEITTEVCHLFRLPREIRDQIYTYVLSSPSGYVGLKESKHSKALREQDPSLPQRFEIFPWHPRYNRPDRKDDGAERPQILLSLLRVCKEVADECKDTFWHNNICYLNADSSAPPPYPSNCWPEATRGSVQHIVMKFDASDCQLNNVECPRVETLRVLGDWARTGSLKSVELNNLDNTLPHIMQIISQKRRFYLSIKERGLVRFILGNEVYPEYLNILREGREVLSHLKRKLSVYDDGVNIIPSRRQLGNLFATFELHPVEMFLQINEAFGGEMWLNGEFCYMDGKMIKMPFALDTEDSKEEEQDMEALDPFFSSG